MWCGSQTGLAVFLCAARLSSASPITRQEHLSRTTFGVNRTMSEVIPGRPGTEPPGITVTGSHQEIRMPRALVSAPGGEYNLQATQFCYLPHT